MKYKVKWTITGEYTVTYKDLDLEESSSLEQAKEAIGDDPWCGIEPQDGKLDYTVEETT